MSLKFHPSTDPEPDTSDVNASSLDGVLTPHQARELYSEIVDVYLRNGNLNKRRRRALVQYAAMLGLGPIDAGRIISRQRKDAQPWPLTASRLAADSSSEPFRFHAAPVNWPRSLSVGIALIAIYLVGQAALHLT